jgi:hypothetical protein
MSCHDAEGEKVRVIFFSKSNDETKQWDFGKKQQRQNVIVRTIVVSYSFACMTWGTTYKNISGKNMCLHMCYCY